MNEHARERGYQLIDIDARDHVLTVYRSRHKASHDGRWHVYLAGDGTPWRNGHLPATDPTPRVPVTLDLMDVDPAPRLLLHRPCYARPIRTENCTATLWTHGRYAEEVVAAMDAGLTALRDEVNMREIVLIGYSGGGTLARLLAARREDVVALVTVAANLDHQAWTRYHGYQPLTDSLRVADTPPLGAAIVQWHFAGGNDGVVPPLITRKGLARDEHARLEIIPGFDHRCCWADIWPERLRRLERLLGQSY